MCQRLGVSERRKCNVWQCKRNDCTYLHPVPKSCSAARPWQLATPHFTPRLHYAHVTPRQEAHVQYWCIGDDVSRMLEDHTRHVVSTALFQQDPGFLILQRSTATAFEKRVELRVGKRVERGIVNTSPSKSAQFLKLAATLEFDRILVQTQTHSETVVDGRVGVGAHHGQRTHQRGGEGAARPSNGREGRSTSMRMQRIIWNWWRTDWVRVEDFPRPYVLGNPPKNPKIESSSCRCSMILIGREEEIQNNVFQVPNKSRTTRRNSRKGTGHSLDLEATRCGMENQITLLKENGRRQPTWWWEQFEESGHPVLISVPPLARGILRKKNNKETIHFSADASNTELLYRTIHSANQLSIYGAVARWCEDFGMKTDEKPPKTLHDEMLREFQPKEVTSVVKAPRNAQPAAGNGMREVQQKFETLGTEVQFKRICKEAAFIHEVAVGRSYRTASDVDDGFGGRTPICREHTKPRTDSDSRIFAAIKQRTIIGPVLQVHTVKCLGICGTEIQIPSTISSKITSCVVICRGQNRNVE